MVKGYTVLSVLMTLLLYFGQPEAVDFYSLINQKEKTNCPNKDNYVNLICETEGNVSEIVIKRTRDEKILSTSRGVNSTQYLIKPVGCSDMGEYQCIINNTRIEKTTLVLSDYGNPFIDINNTSVRRNREGNSPWSWRYLKNKLPSCFTNATIVLKQRDFNKENYGEMNIRVYSSVSRLYYLEYRISLKSPDEVPSSQPTTTATNNPTEEQGTELNVGAVVGGVIAGVLVLAAAVLLVIFIKRREELPQVQAQETPLYEEIIDLQSDNPDRSVYFTKQTPQYVEIIDFQPDTPNRSVYLTNQLPNIQGEVVQYQNTVCAL